MPEAFCASPTAATPSRPPPLPPTGQQQPHRFVTRSSSRHSVTRPLGPDNRSHRVYRCSRCGKPGHNVRACPIPAIWYDQRCGHCGMSGHNIRNCPLRHGRKQGQSLAKDASGAALKCRVCLGRGKLPCSKCAGRVIDPRLSHRGSEDSNVQLVSSGIMTDMQKRMAEEVRKRARRLRAQANGSSDPDLNDQNFGLVDCDSNGSDDGNLTNDDVRLVGFIPEHNASSNGNGHSKSEDNMPCPRCMGSGFLTCMACS